MEREGGVSNKQILVGKRPLGAGQGCWARPAPDPCGQPGSRDPLSNILDISVVVSL